MNKTIDTILKLKPEILLELGECLHEKIKPAEKYLWFIVYMAK